MFIIRITYDDYDLQSANYNANVSTIDDVVSFALTKISRHLRRSDLYVSYLGYAVYAVVGKGKEVARFKVRDSNKKGVENALHCG